MGGTGDPKRQKAAESRKRTKDRRRLKADVARTTRTPLHPPAAVVNRPHHHDPRSLWGEYGRSQTYDDDPTNDGPNARRFQDVAPRPRECVLKKRKSS